MYNPLKLNNVQIKSLLFIWLKQVLKLTSKLTLEAEIEF